MSQSLYFARQPILDIDGKTYAYELLYRSSLEQAFAPIIDDRSATAQVLVNTLNLMGSSNTLGDAFAFINIDEALLMDDMLFSIPKEQFVLEILEHVVITDILIERVKTLKELGYRFALDDADCSKEYILNFQPIFQYIDILKLDITLVDKKRLPNFLALFDKFNLKILAEKVETQEDFDTYKAFGCHYFQGFFFAKPHIIENTRLDPEQIVILKLIQMLQDGTPLNQVNSSFEQNAALTLQLLRFINSAAFSFTTSIKSIRQAITLLGSNQLKSWLLLISYANPANGVKGFENPLLHLAQTRSNMMQTLCKKIHTEKCTQKMLEKAAFIGLLSLVEALFQTPIQTILKELNVDKEIIEILILHKGDIGAIYQLVRAVELFQIEDIDVLLENIHLSREGFAEAIEEAYKITEEFTTSLKS